MSTELVQRLVAAVVGEDLDAFGALYTEDAVMYEPMLPEPARGRDAIVEGERSLFEAFGEVSVDIRSVLSDDDTVVAEVVLSATNDGPLDLGDEQPLPATGHRIEVPMVWVLQVDDTGLITEERDYFDTGLIMRQLGLG